MLAVTCTSTFEVLACMAIKSLVLYMRIIEVLLQRMPGRVQNLNAIIVHICNINNIHVCGSRRFDVLELVHMYLHILFHV